MVIAHNMQAMNANRQYGITTKGLAKTTEKLSSGYKVNRAADDAAGLAISEKMRKQIRGLSQAGANAEDGISMVQIADGAMAEVHEMIDRGLELSVKAANGTLSYTDRCYIQEEIEHLKLEIDGIKERTKFNEIYVLKGELYETAKQVPIGLVNSGGTLPAWVQFGQAQQDGRLSETFTTQTSYIVDTTVTPPVTNTTPIKHAAASIDFSQLTAANVSQLVGTGVHATCCTCTDYYSIEFVSGTPSEVERSGNHFIYKINIDNVTSGADLVNAIIAGTDNGYPNGHYTKLAADDTNPAKVWIYDDRSKESEAATKPADWTANSQWQGWRNKQYGIDSTSGRGQFGEGVMREQTKRVVTGYYEGYQMLALQIGGETDCDNRMSIKLPLISSSALGLADVDVCSEAGADAAITAFHEAKAYVSENRSRMGAYQNRLEHTINNLNNVVENTTAAESQIRDTDMADEMVKHSKYSILAQAGESMIAQSNQQNQGVLSLIA